MVEQFKNQIRIQYPKKLTEIPGAIWIFILCNNVIKMSFFKHCILLYQNKKSDTEVNCNVHETFAL